MSNILVVVVDVYGGSGIGIEAISQEVYFEDELIQQGADRGQVIALVRWDSA